MSIYNNSVVDTELEKLFGVAPDSYGVHQFRIFDGLFKIFYGLVTIVVTLSRLKLVGLRSLGIVCVAVLCGCDEVRVPGSDSGAVDASLADASLADASLADASLADASLADASLADASLADASLADAQPIFPDANVPPTGPCNPVTQMGCASEEKCGELTLSFNPFTAETTCVPDGSSSLGESCSDGTPGATSGFDDCSAGLDCFQGTCQEICASSPDSCPQDSRCAANFQDHFTDEIGVCIPTCDPTNDTVSGGVAINNTCGTGASCGLNIVTADTSCAATPTQSATQTQNEIPFGPGGGQVFTNGCASGFSTLLNENVGLSSGNSHCTRFCTPTETYRALGGTQVGSAAGANGKCSDSALDELGGRNGNNSPHQCRFIQSFYSNTNSIPATTGMCVPVIASGGGETQLSNGATAGPTWGNCTLFEWELLRNSWNAAAPNGEDATGMAFDNFCLSTPSDPSNSGILDRCIGFFYGCLSVQMNDELLPPAAASNFSLRSFQEHYEHNLSQRDESGMSHSW